MTTVSLCYAILALVTASVPTPEPRLAQATQTIKSTPVSITATIEAIERERRCKILEHDARVRAPRQVHRHIRWKTGDE